MCIEICAAHESRSESTPGRMLICATSSSTRRGCPALVHRNKNLPNRRGYVKVNGNSPKASRSSSGYRLEGHIERTGSLAWACQHASRSDGEDVLSRRRRNGQSVVFRVITDHADFRKS